MYGAWHLELHGRLGNPAITKEAVTIYDKSARNVKNSHSLNGRIHVAIGVSLDMRVTTRGGESDGTRSSVICLFYFFFKENESLKKINTKMPDLMKVMKVKVYFREINCLY